ncbi:hypothetical protein [Methyloglobulus sp.]
MIGMVVAPQYRCGLSVVICKIPRLSENSGVFRPAIRIRLSVGGAELTY